MSPSAKMIRLRGLLLKSLSSCVVQSSQPASTFTPICVASSVSDRLSELIKSKLTIAYTTQLVNKQNKPNSPSKQSIRLVQAKPAPTVSDSFKVNLMVNDKMISITLARVRPLILLSKPYLLNNAHQNHHGTSWFLVTIAATT